jgi:hypothetical protein
MGNSALAESLRAQLQQVEREAQLAAALDPANRALLEQIFALQDQAAALTKLNAIQEEAKALAQQELELRAQIAELMGNSALAESLRAELLRLEREAQLAAALDDANRALLEQIFALQDQATALTKLNAIQEEATSLTQRLLQAQADLATLMGDSAAAAAYQAQLLQLQRQAELAAALDDANRALLEQIFALEDAIMAMEKYKEAATQAIEDEYQARISRLDGQKEALSRAHDLRMKEIETQRAAAQAALQEAESALSAIQSALNSMRSSQEFNELAHARAAKQLAQWAEGGWLPRTDQLERTLDVLARSAKEDFATEQQWRLSQGKTFANLLKVEAVASQRVMWETAVLAYLDKEQERMEEQLRLEQAAVDAQMQHAEAWRDEQMAALTALLASNQAVQMVNAEGAGQMVNAEGASQRVNAEEQVITWPTQAERQAEASAAQTSEIKGLREEIAMLRKDMAAAATAQVAPLKSLDDRTRKWDLDGLPAGRDDVTVLRAA